MRSAPRVRLARAAGDQRAHLSAHPRSAERASGAPPPERAPAAAVPGDDVLGSDQDQVAAPTVHEAAGRQPEELVVRAEPSAFAGGAGQHRELLAHEQVLRDQLAAAPKRRADQVGQKEEVVEQHAP